MRRMIADRVFPYRGVSLAVGQEFDADDEHVDIFTMIGHAHLAEGEEPDTVTRRTGQEYDTRVMVAGKPKRRKA